MFRGRLGGKSRTCYRRRGGVTLRARSRIRVAAPAYLVGAALVAVWLVLRLLYLGPPQPSDQVHYLQYATEFPGPVGARALPHQYLRYGIIAPTALMTWAFGYSQAAYYALPLVAGVLLIVGCYALGTLLFARTVGVAAALLLAFQSQVFATSSQLLPDLFAAALFTAAVALAVGVRQGHIRRRRVALVAIGLLLGWSYLVREFILFVWPLVPLVLYRRTGWRGMLWLAAPAAAVWFAEGTLTWLVYGDPLARLHATIGAGDTVSSRPGWSGGSPVPYLERLPAVLLRAPEGGWLVGILGIAVAGALARSRRVALLVLWVALWWVPLTLLGGALAPDAPKINLANVRYWLLVYPPIIVGGLGSCWLVVRWFAGWFAGRLASWVARGTAGGSASPPASLAASRPVSRLAPAAAGVAVLVLAAIPLGTAVGHWWDRPSYRANGATQLEWFRTWMSAHDGEVDTVWSDRRTAHLLKMYRHGTFGATRWDAQQRTLGAESRPEPGDFVVLYNAQGGGVCAFCAREARVVLGSPPHIPPTWRQVYATGDGVLRIYRVVAGTTQGRPGRIGVEASAASPGERPRVR